MNNEEAIANAVKRLIDRYGRRAPREAAIRAEELLAAGDSEGHVLWRTIKRRADTVLGPRQDAEKS